jgi:hypothetical protein
LSASSDSSPFQSPSRTLDISGSSTSFSSDRAKIAAAHQWKSGPVEQWNNEQVILKLWLHVDFSKFAMHTFSFYTGLSLASRHQHGAPSAKIY